MKLSYKSVAALAALSLFVAPLLAQSAAVPDAPMPTAPVPAPHGTKTLVLPAPGSLPLEPSYVPPGPKDADAAKAHETKQVCGGDPSGVYTLANMDIPLELRGQMHVYEVNMFSRVMSNWNRKYKAYAQYSAFAHGKIVGMRLAIYPDGSYVQPEITHPSGSDVDDSKAMAAVRDNDAFPPLPKGIGHPVVMCMHFGYNIDVEDMGMNYDEKWLKEKKKP